DGRNQEIFQDNHPKPPKKRFEFIGGVMRTGFNLIKKAVGKAKNLAYRFFLSNENFKLWLFNFKGKIPWSEGYNVYKKRFICQSIEANLNFNKLPQKYGYRIDERAVEYPWLFSRLNDGFEFLLDAGSFLNFDYILSSGKLKDKKIFISTLAPESSSCWDKGISYIYEDLRSTCFRDEFFDTIVCCSTLEHVGLDNTLLYTGDMDKKENKTDTYLDVISEFKRILKPGGRVFITVPYGKNINYKWFQVFNSAMVEDIVKTFNGSTSSVSYFMYKNDGWSMCDKQSADGNEDFFDIHTSAKYFPDYLAFSRAIVCIELKK
ncbi:MAG TPA: methyltransferase domain-containing protein, partial [Candidatus Wallbacteria bacterium]|nr:methyltransferase domain-containing protein [Candidatus Wallbacteria bacterium]